MLLSSKETEAASKYLDNGLAQVPAIFVILCVCLQRVKIRQGEVQCRHEGEMQWFQNLRWFGLHIESYRYCVVEVDLDYRDQTDWCGSVVTYCSVLVFSITVQTQCGFVCTVGIIITLWPMVGCSIGNSNTLTSLLFIYERFEFLQRNHFKGVLYSCRVALESQVIGLPVTIKSITNSLISHELRFAGGLQLFLWAVCTRLNGSAEALHTAFQT